MITREDMEQRFGTAEIDALTDGSADTLNRAIADAEAEAAGYLAAAGFRRPFVQTPRVLVLKICDIARYYLHQDGDISIVDKRYKAAVAWFQALIRNPSMLGGDEPAAADKAASGRYAVIPNAPEDFDASNRKF
ncbi:Mu-like prophage protein gp36 [Kingella potus]|uniref:Mu-like prophage protein gp36 n=1 Tax=Kingella potus TaxID=265175 RepID=A0A377QWR6_9NEIS|nr:phage protein Gp36 family protein [Kingella potus]UOP00535.1 DUF1320 family protein [Kingella potus]UOP02014.1 DUF1320 family protein [Kingella potus]STQ99846.1 Mu-like prophage protein gp36 [Kingella potus]